MSFRKFIFIVTAILLTTLIIAIWYFPPNDNFRIENPFWNGLGDIMKQYPVQGINSLADLPSSPEGTTLIAIPYLEYTTAEIRQLREFGTRGGRIILADDYGYGNGVLEGLELKPRFTNQVLVDPMVNYKNEQFPRIIHLLPDPMTEGVDNLVLNHATSLINVESADILALSSSFSFLDTNNDGKRSDDEIEERLPVISRHSLGQGQLILIADPSLFINGMTFEGNTSFIRNISAGSSIIYIDQSHLPPSEILQTKDWLQQTRYLFSTPAGILGITLTALVLTTIPLWRKKRGTAL